MSANSFHPTLAPSAWPLSLTSSDLGVCLRCVIDSQICSICFSAAMSALDDFTDHFHAYSCTQTPQGSPPAFPAPADGLHTCSQLPQTLTAAGAEVWVGAHYLFVDHCQNEAKVF